MAIIRVPPKMAAKPLPAYLADQVNRRQGARAQPCLHAGLNGKDAG